MKLLAFSDLHRDLGQAARLVEMSSEADVVIGADGIRSVVQREIGLESRPTSEGTTSKASPVTASATAANTSTFCVWTIFILLPRAMV